MEQIFTLKTPEETHALGSRFATCLKPKDIVALYGTLGAGKTAFCRGIIQALSENVKEVPSPTFTLVQTYPTSAFEIWHFDFYRLKKPEEAWEIGIEDAFFEGVSLLEWPEKIGSILPINHINIFFDIVPEGRRLTIETDRSF